MEEASTVQQRVPVPTKKPLPRLPFSSPSGQPSVPGVFAEPLVGKPEPMGATLDAAGVSVCACVCVVKGGGKLKDPRGTSYFLLCFC